MVLKYDQAPQPEGEKTFMEQIREKAQEAAPAVIVAALGATLGYVGAEVTREAAVKPLIDIMMNPQNPLYGSSGDALHLAVKIIAEKTQELPAIFAAIGGGFGVMTTLALDTLRKKGLSRESQTTESPATE